MEEPLHPLLEARTAAASNLSHTAAEGDHAAMAKNELVTPLGDSAMDETNNAARVVLATLITGEDQANDVLRVEGQFSGIMVAADTQIKASPGFVHTLTFSQASLPSF